MSDLSILETKIRTLINDNALEGTDILTRGSSDVFTLTEPNVISVSTAYQNNVELGSGDWAFDTETKKFTLNVSGAVDGDIIEVAHSYYANYSPSEIQSYIRSALVHISANNYTTWMEVDYDIYPKPLAREMNLIALVASILINPENISYRLPDMSASVPKDLPTTEKVRRTIAIFKKDSSGIFSILGNI